MELKVKTSSFIVMGNEDKIVELLAENLKNQDIQSEKLDSLVDVVKDVAHALQHQAGMLEKLVSKYDKLDDLEHRLFLLERKLGKAE
ncbi:MAG: hypothetical protein WAZ98_09590 [Cyclobacteriaceae bacterium]